MKYTLLTILLLALPLCVGAQTIKDANELKQLTWSCSDTNVVAYVLTIAPYRQEAPVKEFRVEGFAQKSAAVTNVFAGVPEGVYDVVAYSENAHGVRSLPSNVLSVNWGMTKPKAVTGLNTATIPKPPAGEVRARRVVRSPRGGGR